MISFRCLTPKDADEFRKLRLESLQVAPEAFSNSYKNEMNYPMSTFESLLLHTPDHITVGAFSEDQLIASCSFSRMLGPYVRHKGKLMGLYCQPAYQGKSISYQLLKILLNEIQQLDHLFICQLSVVSTNIAAIHLYEKLGFKRYGYETNSLYDGKQFRDEYLYQLLFNK